MGLFYDIVLVMLVILLMLLFFSLFTHVIDSLDSELATTTIWESFILVLMMLLCGIGIVGLLILIK